MSIHAASTITPTTPPILDRDLASPAYLGLGRLPFRELEAIMLRGERPDPRALAGREFRGMNVAAFTKLLGIKKFIKGFYENESGQLYGYNMPVVQNRLDEPWLYKNPGDPRRFGFFRVDPVDAATRDNAYLSSLLLDYGRGGNHELDPTSGLRDYLTRVDRGSDELLLGKAYYALGPLRVPAGYFVLERLRETDFRR
jgi:hypothetical protein